MSADDDAAILALVARIGRRRADLEPIAAVILAAAHLGLAADSRSLAKAFDVAHAHALRAVAALEEAGLLTVSRRDARSGRAHYALARDGTRLMAASDADPHA